MPTNIDSLSIDISAQSKDASDSLDSLLEKLNKISASLNVGKNSKGFTVNINNGLKNTNQTARKTTKHIKSLAAAFGTFYANCFLAIRGVKALAKSINETSDYIESYNYFNVALGKIGADWSNQWEQYGYDSAESYAESFQKRLSERLTKLSGVQIDEDAGLLVETGMKNLGLNIKEVAQYASQLASVTNSVGQTGEVSLAAADAFTRLAGDIGSLFNIDYSSVAQNIQSGLIGQSRALYKYGIDITNATLQTYAYEMGLEKAVSEMTQAEKMQLRMIAILDQSKVSWGDLARTIESPSNQMRIFKNNLSETSIILGQLFIPLLTKVMPILNGTSIAIKRILVDIAGIMGVELNLDQFGQGYDGSAEDMAEDFDSLTDSVNDAKKSLRGFDELKTISGNSGASINGGLESIDLTEQIIKATQEYQTVWDQAFSNMENKAGEFASNIEWFFTPLKNIVKDLKDGDFKGVFRDVGESIDVLLIAFSKITGIDIGLVSLLFDSVISALAGFALYKGIPSIITKASSAFKRLGGVMGTLKAHPYLTIASGLIAVLNAFGSYKERVSDLAEIEKYGDTIEGLTSGVKSLREEIEEDRQVARDGGRGTIEYVNTLATEYLNLYNQEKLSADENQRLQDLHDLLSEKLPGFDTVIENTTATYEDQKAAIDELIASLSRSYQMRAMESYIINLLDKKIKVQKELENAQKAYNDVLDETQKYYDKYDQSTLTGALAFNAASLLNYGSPNAIREMREDARKYLSETEAALNDIEENITWAYGRMGITIGEEAKESGSEIGKEMAEGISETEETVKNSIENMTSAIDQSINDSVPSVAKTAYDQGENIGESLIKGINSGVLNSSIIASPQIKMMLSKDTSPIYRASLFADGGFPDRASLFFAGENGIPEIVGTVGGSPAVASGTEITGIADAVYSTGQTEAGLLQTAVGLLQIIAEKDFGITTDDIGRSAKQYAQDYFRRNGKPAYAF